MERAFEMYVTPLREQTFALWVFQKMRGKDTEELLSEITANVSETYKRWTFRSRKIRRPLLDGTKRHILWEYILDRVSEVQGRAGEMACSVKGLLHKHDNLNLTPAAQEKPGMITLIYNSNRRRRQVETGWFWGLNDQQVLFNCKLNTIKRVCFKRSGQCS